MKFKCSDCGKERSPGFVAFHAAAHRKLAQMPHTYVEAFPEPPEYNPDSYDGYQDYRAMVANHYSYPYCESCGGDPSNRLHNRTFIEFPAQGATYGPHRDDGRDPEYGVYEYGYYEATSVLSGQSKRSCVGIYETLEAAQTAHPGAIWEGEGSNYTEPVIPDNAPAWFDPTAIGESWDGE
jgi:hypothetical protein